MSHSSEKCGPDRETDRQTDRQTQKSDFIGPSAGQGSKQE